ncbi:MAG: hypothetical protein GY696_16560, partial [Gammaproteobacteria bacterium]|nr:hypothetical protein [Gammaproteobacteria bacterium]
MELAPAIAALINKSLHNSEFPAAFKHARIATIPKVPGTMKVSEMRPISILPVLSKIHEQWFLRILRPLIFNPPDDNQFAYLSGRSVEDALALVQFYISSGFKACPRTTKVAVVSLDVSKAFDKVPRNCLLKSLQDRLVPDSILRLLRSYLCERRQTVRIGKTESAPQPVHSGVAQGSILGPNLFIAYISSVLNLDLSSNCHLVAYADDLLVIK